MSAKDRYNSIIQEIEDLATTQYLRPAEIAGIVATNHGIVYREMATVLNFMTESQLTSHIRSRQYNAAYRHIITSKTFDVNGALMIANVADQSGLTKIFRKQFGMTPKQAFDLKDASKLLPPKSWDEISCASEVAEAVEPEVPETETVFGVDAAIYERITQINDLQAAYGLDRNYSTLAVHLSDSLELDFGTAFGYVEGFKAERDFALEDDERDEESISEIMTDAWLWNNATDPDVLYCYTRCGLSVSSALWVVQELRELGHGPIRELSPLFLRSFNDGWGLHSHFLKEACEYYEEHTDDRYSDKDFVFFLDQLRMGRPIEIAFDEMVFEKDFEENLDDIPHMDFLDYETDEMFEKWASRETKYRGSRFDEDFDPDNPYDD